MPIRTALAAACCLVAAAVEPANRLAGDTSFETGTAGWMTLAGPDGPVLDGTTAADGRTSLRLAPGAPWICSAWQDDLLQSGKPAVVSFWARSEGKGEHISCSVLTTAWRWVAERSFDLDTNWRRFHFVVPAQGAIAAPVQIAFMGKRLTTAWVDAVQVESGEEPGPFTCAGDIAWQATTGIPGEVVMTGNGQPVTLTVSLRNLRLDRARFPLTVQLRPTRLHGLPLPTVSAQVPNPGSEVGAAVLTPLPSDLPGYYQIAVAIFDRTGTTVATGESPIAVVPCPRPLSPGASFFGLHPNYVPHEALRRIGAKWIRNNGLAWNHRTEPEPGCFPEPPAAGYAHIGADWLATLRVQDPPPWGADMRGMPVDGLAFRRYLEAVATASRRAAVCELQNEPDLELGTVRKLPMEQAAATFAALLRTAHEELSQRGMPVAMNTSGVGERFAELVLTAAPGACDIYAPHPYTYPRYLGPAAQTAMGPEAGGMQAHLLRAVDLARRRAGGCPVWAGELGWGHDRHVSLAHPCKAVLGDWLARAYLLAKAVPQVKRMVWFTSLGCVEGGRYEYGMWQNRNGIKPLPAVAAYAALAAAIDGTEPLPPIHDGLGKALAFADGERRVIALWNASDEVEAGITIAIPGPLMAATDVTGHPLARTQDGGVLVRLTGSPCLITCNAGRFAAVSSLIAAHLAVSRPAELAIVIPARDRLAVRVHNLTRNPLKGVVSATIAGRPATTETALALAAEGQAEIELPLAISIPTTGASVSATFAVAGGAAVTRTRTVPTALIAAHGQPATAAILNRPEQVMPPDGGWKGPDDLSATVALGYDNLALTIIVAVRDDIHRQGNRGSELWRGDSIQFAIDASADAQDAGYDGNDHEFTCAREGTSAVLWRHHGGHGPGAVASATCTIEDAPDGRMVYRIALPWSEMAPLVPVSGRTFGFNLAANDDDGAGRAFWISLASGIADGKHPERFPLVQLAEP